MHYGAVILAGGKSRRMGQNKAELTLHGVRFLDKLVYELSGFPEILISVDDVGRHPEIPYPMIGDVFPDCGPMGGLYAALKYCRSEALFTVSCDTPLVSKGIADALCDRMDKDVDVDAVIVVTGEGRKHPLCGIYRKSCLPILEKLLQQGQYRMMELLKRLQIRTYDVGTETWRLMNVNTPQEMKRLRTGNCLAVCGWKNAGKTTLVEGLLPLLKRNGLTVAVVKHDGHSYVPDVPGTDSYRFFQAGADAAVIFDAEKCSLTRRCNDPEAEAERLAEGADLILLEGFKKSTYPKLEIVRKEQGAQPMAELRGRIAYVSDRRDIGREIPGLPVFAPDDQEAIAAFILKAYRSGALKERYEAAGQIQGREKED